MAYEENPMPIQDCAIVMLAHNGAEFTVHALQSILRAEDLPREIFLVDNGSDDSTPELFAEAIPRLETAGVAVTSWRNEENKGCSLARNEAWEKVTAAYTVLMDNDAAVCTSTWLSRFMAEFGRRPGDRKSVV